jgi:hypothetical protein
MKSGRKKMLAAFGLILAVAVFLVYRSVAFRSNTNAFAETTARLDATQLSLVEALIATERAGLTRNEESGLEYFHSQAVTGEKNRVYVMWWIAGPGSAAYDELHGMVGPAEKYRPEIGVAVYVDIGFHSFRTRQGKMLGRFFDEHGLTPVRATGYFRDLSGSWRRARQIENEKLVSLIPEDRKRAILEGAYNAVYFDGGGGQ